MLTAEWVAPFVPKPSIQEVIKGAFSDQTKKYGYNASFYYPKEGGIQALAFAFAQRNLPKDIRLNTEVVSVLGSGPKGSHSVSHRRNDFL